MPSKKALIEKEKEAKQETSAASSDSFVRIEESIEDYLKLMLPSVAGTQMQVCPLWTDKSGNTYYRCKYWQYSLDKIVMTRREIRSRFVRVERSGSDRTIVDVTVTK